MVDAKKSGTRHQDLTGETLQRLAEQNTAPNVQLWPVFQRPFPTTRVAVPRVRTLGCKDLPGKVISRRDDLYSANQVGTPSPCRSAE